MREIQSGTLDQSQSISKSMPDGKGLERGEGEVRGERAVFTVYHVKINLLLVNILMC